MSSSPSETEPPEQPEANEPLAGPRPDLGEMPPAPAANRLLRPLLTLGLILLLSGGLYFKLQSTGAAKAAGKGPKHGKSRPVPVSVAPVTRSDLPIKVSAIGNVEALESVSIQPQISGRLKRVYFSEGAQVRKGQLLFEIDPRIQTATVAQSQSELARGRSGINQAKANLAKAQTQIAVAKANLKRDQGQLDFANRELSRNQTLRDKHLIPQEELEQSQNAQVAAAAAVTADEAALRNVQAQIEADKAALQTATAGVNANQAALDAARVQLSFTKIYAPITGKTGPLLIHAGNTVQANSSTLVNIRQLSPLSVAFTIPEKLLSRFQRAQQSGQVPVTAIGHGAQAEPQQGQLSFIDNTVNKNTGTVLLKARFANLQRQLWPGQYVDVSVQLGLQKQALSIPAAAIQTGPDGDFVYVVQEQKAQLKPVQVDRIEDGVAVIAKGLQVHQQVVVAGQLNLAPNSPVLLKDQAPKAQGDAQ